jgi:hypothetical protein
MSWWLYLDDLRTPKTEHDWVVVRDYDAFVAQVEARGFPGHVSFDHDLGEDTPSGMECARWLVERGIALGVDPREVDWNVHSANVVGAANIRGLYQSWCKHHASLGGQEGG